MNQISELFEDEKIILKEFGCANFKGEEKGIEEDLEIELEESVPKTSSSPLKTRSMLNPR